MYQGHPKIQEWCEKREIVIACLKSLADQLDKFHRNANKAGIVGDTVGVGGTVIGLTAVAVAPFCGGVSLVPGVLIATGSGIVGTASSVAGKVAEGTKKKKVFNNVESLLEEDKSCTEEVQKLAQRLDEAGDVVQRYLTELVVSNLSDAGQASDGQTTQPKSSSDPGLAGSPVQYKKDVPSSKSGSAADLDQVKTVLTTGLSLVRRSNINFMKQMFQIGKTFVKDGAQAGKGALKAVKIGKVAKVGGIVVTVAILPLEVADLVTRVKDWKDKKGHPSSKEILVHAKKLQEGIALVEKELRGKLTAINNLVLLIQYIKNQGCPDRLNSFLNQILKKLLPIKDLIKAFDKVTEPTSSDKATFTLDEEEISGMLINYRDVNSNIFRELAVVLWTAWQMGSKSFVFLQNTTFTAAPALWTLFGVSMNSFGTESEQGVSILLPLDFQGDVVSHQEFQDSSNQHSDWHGRCLLVNISINDTQYTLVNLLAPEERTDRALFLQEVTSFINRHSQGKIIIAANFQREIHTMTVRVRKGRVCPNTPWPLMEKFLPYREIAEYLQCFHPYEKDEPGMKVYKVCEDFTAGDSQLVFIDWKHCEKPIVSVENCSTQLDTVTKLGLLDLWNKKNPRTVEFSTERRISKEVASCSRSMEFFVACELEQIITSCSFDHDLRFLGFTKEAVLIFGGKPPVRE